MCVPGVPEGVNRGRGQQAPIKGAEKLQTLPGSVLHIETTESQEGKSPTVISCLLLLPCHIMWRAAGMLAAKPQNTSAEVRYTGVSGESAM